MRETTLTGGRWLNPGYWIKSPNGRYQLIYQNDGNLVLYGPGNQALWNSGTWGRSAGRAIIQNDGNLVVYDAGGRSVWHSGTWGNAGARLALQDDGNLVVYATNGRAVWNSGTYGGRSVIARPSNQAANLAAIIGPNHSIWRSATHQTTVHVRRTNEGHIVSWDSGGGNGRLTIEENRLVIHWPYPGTTKEIYAATGGNISSSRIVWDRIMPQGGYRDIWTKVSSS